MDKQIIVLIAVVAIVVLSGIQLVQINNMKENFATKGFVIGNSVAQSTTQQIAPPQQASASSMVGGC